MSAWEHEALALAIVGVSGVVLRFALRAFKNELREMIREMIGNKVEEHERRILSLEQARAHQRR